MRSPWWMVLLAGCATPPSRPATTPPPAVEIEKARPVVMAPAIRPTPTTPSAWRPGQLRPNGDGPVPIYGDDPVRGDDLAPVTLVLFTDYQCPPCAMGTSLVAAVQAELGDAIVRVAHKHFPLPNHPAARPAAEAAVAVHQLGGMEAFETFAQLLFEGQGSFTEATFEAWAAEAGVAASDLSAFLAQPAASAKVDRDVALARALEVAGVPEVIVNGKRLDGTLEAPALRAAIEAEVAQVEQLRRDGAPRDATYQTRCEAQANRD